MVVEYYGISFDLYRFEKGAIVFWNQVSLTERCLFLSVYPSMLNLQVSDHHQQEVAHGSKSFVCKRKNLLEHTAKQSPSDASFL